MLFLLTLLLYIPAAIVRGWALSLIWGWFIVPTFGAPPLSIVPAIGISLLVSMLVAQPSKTVKTNEEVATAMVTNIVESLTYLLFAWVWSLFL